MTSAPPIPVSWCNDFARFDDSHLNSFQQLDDQQPRTLDVDFDDVADQLFNDEADASSTANMTDTTHNLTDAFGWSNYVVSGLSEYDLEAVLEA